MKNEENRIEREEMRKLQLGILESIHRFCSSHSIKYSLACGTMLGAVRHKGFIPWDDDIDIYLLREDYNRLVQLFPEVYDNRYQLVSLERETYWDRPYAKAFDNRTLFIENSSDSVHIGVNIDIYPIDDVPDNERRWILYNRFRRFLQKINSVKNIKIGKGRSLWKNILLVFLKFPVLFINRRHYAYFLSWYSQLNDNKGYQSAFECVQGMLQKNRFRKALFSELCEYQFEDKRFWGFKDYDEYLSNGYGDYWRLPPEEKRVSHHDFIARWIQ